MASWQQIQNEIIAVGTPDQHDVIRRQKIARVKEVTQRELVIYAVDFPGSNPLKSQFVGGMTQISLADKDGFDEVTRNLSGPNLDVLLHSPGGSAEATESIVEILRARFSGQIRFIVPNLAKSAATMLAMSGNQIIMNERSELGPTDPQMLLVRDRQQIVAPAQAIKDQFLAAQKQINDDPKTLPGWVPLLQQYGPSLLAECDNHIGLAEQLVAKWLEKYMFAGDPQGSTEAATVAAFLSNHNNFRSHGRRIGIEELVARGVKVLDMRTDRELEGAVNDLYTALMITFSGTGAIKLFENSINEAFVIAVDIQVEQGVPQLVPAQEQPRQGKSKKSDLPPRGQRHNR